MKKTVWITAGVILSASIIGLLGSCRKSDSSGSRHSESRYQVECKPVASGYTAHLEVKVKGPAAKLAVILSNPKGETDTKIIQEEEMIDNIESVRVSMVERGAPEPGTYTLLIKTFNPEEVAYKENLEFTLGKVSIEDVKIEFTPGMIRPYIRKIVWIVKNEGSLPVLFNKVSISLENHQSKTREHQPRRGIISVPGVVKHESQPHVMIFYGLKSKKTYTMKARFYLERGEDKFLVFEKRLFVPE